MVRDLQISPSATVFQVFDQRSADTEGAGDAGRANPYIEQSLYRPGLSVGYASVVLTFFTAPVVGVLFVRPENQMIGVDAGGRVALVHYDHAFGYGAICEYVCNAVRKLFRRCSARPYKPVPHVVFVGEPQPTIVRLPAYELFVKSIYQRFHTVIMGKHLAGVKAHGGCYR